MTQTNSRNYTKLFLWEALPWLIARGLFLLLGICFLLTFESYGQINQSEKPNIIFILVDDMGWNGLSSYGNRHVETPNIDRLADQGMKFTQAYVSPECTPTRGELISGQFTARTGITQVHIPRTYPNAPITEPEVTGKLPEDNYTIANMLKDAGYATMVSGKWHLGGGRVADIKENRGMEFFEQYGFDFAGDAIEREWSRDHGVYSEEDKEKANLNIINDFFRFAGENEGQPLFAYLSFFSPHTPIVAPDSLVEKYSDNGFPTSTELFGDATAKPTANYAAMVKFLDQSIGQLLDDLDEKGLSDETMIVFMSDNGGLNRAWDNYPLRGAKGMLYEGGIRVPLIVSWPGEVEPESKSDVPVHIVDMFATFKELAGGDIPEDKKLDGENLLPLLTGQENLDNSRAIYWHHPHYIHDYGKTPSSAIRKGDYKLIYYYGDYLETQEHLPLRGEPHGELQVGERVELFNLNNDPHEQYDLSEKQSQLADEMLNDLKQMLNEVDAPMPQKNPDADLSHWHKTQRRN